MKFILGLLSSILLLTVAAAWYRFWMSPAQAVASLDGATEAVQLVTVINEQADDIGVSTSDSAAVATPTAADFDWQIPAWLPPPPVPADNPMSDSKVSLTDTDFLSNPRNSDPWPEGHPARGKSLDNPLNIDTFETRQP